MYLNVGYRPVVRLTFAVFDHVNFAGKGEFRSVLIIAAL